MPADLSDETFIARDRPSVAAVIGDPQRWIEWWPDLELEVTRDRGDKGRQWVLTGQIAGTAEIYLEPWHDGTIVHLFLRLQPRPGTGSVAPRSVGPARTAAESTRQARHRTLRWKRTIHRLKDELEGGRRAGVGARTGTQVDHRS